MKPYICPTLRRAALVLVGTLLSAQTALAQPVLALGKTDLSSSIALSNCLRAVRYSIVGDPASTSTTLDGLVEPGDQVEVQFVVRPPCRGEEFSLVAYTAPGAVYDPTTASQQRIFASATTNGAAGIHRLRVRVPSCYFQIDFVRGPLIEILAPPTETYTAQGRLISFDNGGAVSCEVCPPVTTP